MSKSDFERSLDRVAERRWAELRSFWLSHIPGIEPPGSAYEGGLTMIAGLEEYSLRVLDHKHGGLENVALPGLAEAVMHEGIFFLHKAAHVLGVAEHAATGGNPTWALPNAYSAGIFAARSILCFLGLDFAQVNSKAVLVDIWMPASDARTRRNASRVQTVARLGIDRPDHRTVWSLFQRCLRVSRVESWPKKVVSRLRHLDHKSFAKQRNYLQYRADSWVYNDLHLPCSQIYFGMADNWDEGDFLDHSMQDFSMILGITLFTLAAMLLKDLADISNRLSPEWQLLSDRLTGTWCHPLLLQNNLTGRIL